MLGEMIETEVDVLGGGGEGACVLDVLPGTVVDVTGIVLDVETRTVVDVPVGPVPGWS